MGSTMSRNQIIALAVVSIMIIAVVCIIVIPPWTHHNGGVPVPTPTCIQVPVASNERERKPVADLSAKLEAVPIDASLKVSFEEKSKLVYATLTEKELAFWLLLAAIECYLQKADTPAKAELVKPMLPELVAIARDMWTSSHELKGAAGPKLSLKEVDLLKESPYGQPILEKLKKFGVSE